jgi:hypothetical protein
MPLRIDDSLTTAALLPRIEAMFELSGAKILSLEKSWEGQPGAPVFTKRGRYTARGWTEWTQGFQYGSALLQFEATGEQRFLKLGRENTFERMAPHVSHKGVHDHGFNNVSTYGNLRRLMLAGRIPQDPREMAFYELALKTSAAVQAARWTEVERGGGFIYSFNGPHSLFVDTMRSLRVLALGHVLGHVLMGERDRRICLLERLLQHADTTAAFNVYYGESRDAYDIAGRTAHESVFNVNEHATRLFTFQHLDARPGVGHSGICGAAGVFGGASVRRLEAGLPGRCAGHRALPGYAPVRKGGLEHRGLLPAVLLHGWNSRLGHRSAGFMPHERLPGPGLRPVQ